MKWRLIDYDVWGNARDGFEVNAAYTTSTYVEFDEGISDAALIKLLKREGLLKKGLRASSIDMDGDEYTIYFSDARNGRPEFELRREDR